MQRTILYIDLEGVRSLFHGLDGAVQVATPSTVVMEAAKPLKHVKSVKLSGAVSAIYVFVVDNAAAELIPYKFGKTAPIVVHTTPCTDANAADMLLLATVMRKPAKSFRNTKHVIIHGGDLIFDTAVKMMRQTRPGIPQGSLMVLPSCQTKTLREILATFGTTVKVNMEAMPATVVQPKLPVGK